MATSVTTPDIEMAKLDNWFEYHEPTAEQIVAYKLIRVTAAVATANASIACQGR